MFRGKSDTFTSDLLRNPIFLFGLMCLAFLGLKKLASVLRFGSIGALVQTYSYEMVRGKDATRILTVDDYPTVVRHNNWTPPQNRNPMSGDPVKNTGDGPAAPGQAAATGTKSGTAVVAGSKAQQKRKPKVQVDVIGSDPVKSVSNDSDSSAQHSDVVFYGAPPIPVSAPAPVAPEEAKEDQKKLTLNDWRAMLTNVNRQNIDKLVSARKSGGISSADYYALVKELIMSHVDDRQKAGVYALNNDLSAASFEFIVVSKAQVAPAVQSALAQTLKKYEEPAQANALATVLAQNKTPEVQMEAMKSLTVAVTALKKQVSAQGEGRNPAVAAQAQRDLLALVPALRRMSTAGEETSGMAADLLSQIESLTQKSEA